MAMLNERIPYDNILRIKPVVAKIVNGKRETMAQVKARTGCHLIINGGTYTPQYKPDSGLKIDGEVLGKGYMGLGSNDERTLEISYAGTWHKDYFGAYGDYIRDGVYSPVLSGSVSTTKRGRTGIGITDKELVIVSIADNEKSKCSLPTFMRTYFAGCKHAINLDGGGSSQWDGPYGKYESGRRVLWYLCIWLKEPTVAYQVFNVKTYLAARDKPSVICKELGQLHTGDVVRVKAWSGSYAEIDYNGRSAFVTGKYIKRVV